MFTSTRTSEPACNTLPCVKPTAFLLNIFSTAVKPCPSTDTSLAGANTTGASMPKVLAAKVWIFYRKQWHKNRLL